MNRAETMLTADLDVVFLTNSLKTCRYSGLVLPFFRMAAAMPPTVFLVAPVDGVDASPRHAAEPAAWLNQGCAEPSRAAATAAITPLAVPP